MSEPDEAAPRSGEFRHCPRCGTALERRERGGRWRGVCPACGYVAYRNPAVGVAVIVRDDAGRVLLGRRRGSYAGQWCIPCGYVEWDEDVRAAAVREFEEETGLRVRLGPVAAVHSNFHNPAQHTVGVWFTGAVTGGEPRADDDLDAVAFFPLDALPEPLAFPTDRIVLEELRGHTPSPAMRERGATPENDALS
jgi:ADP-ribose pyrophosphatase YjhB (NUDIX family)